MSYIIIRKKQIFALICILALFGCAASPASQVNRINNDYQHNKTEKAISEVNQLTDQDILIELAKNSDYYQVRMAAIEKITDQEFLQEFVKNNIEFIGIPAAIKRIIDQNFLLELAKNKDPIVRAAAVKGITDQKVVIDMAKNDTIALVRAAAAEKITDKNILVEMATNNENDSVRETAVKGIIDQKVLIEIARNDRNTSVREAAVERITDRDVLIDFVKNAHFYNVKLVAATTLQYLLNGPVGIFKTLTPKQIVYNNPNFGRLMLVALDPHILERYGWLKIDIEINRKFEEYGSRDSISQWHQLTVIDYAVMIKAEDGKTILEREFKAIPPGASEAFGINERMKTRRAYIDCDAIRYQLLSE